MIESSSIRLRIIGITTLLFLSACRDAPRSSELQGSPPKGSAPNSTASLAHRQILEKIFATTSDCSDASASSESPAQLRRLTREEWSHSVQDILALDLDFSKFLPADESAFGFKNNSALNTVSVDHALAYSQAAGKAAEEFVRSRWTQFMSCSISDGRSCAQELIRKYAPRIWRRPLQENEETLLLQVYDTGAEQSADIGIKLTLRALFTAPAFLYRSEIGKDGQLDAYEWASALAYFFWASTPDEQLLQSAGDGTLMTEAGLAAEIERLLASPKARQGLSAFADSWLNYRQVLQVSKDGNLFPEFDSATRLMLAHETEAFFDHFVRDRRGTYRELLSADYTLGDPTLAAYYQAPFTPGSGTIDLRPTERRGILGHASILASLAYAHETHPIKRGVFMREHLLCEELSPPPASLNVQPPPPKEGATTRERFAAHVALPVCKSCHVRIDGIGFGMEDFDPIGRFRSSDAGKAVDRSGELFDVDGQTQAFSGAMGLTSLLASSDRSQRCFALQWFRMASGRIETSADICTVRALGDQLASGLSMRDFIVRLITNPAYRYRSL